jgi:hypothetical protein
MKAIILIMLACVSNTAIAAVYKCSQSGATIYSSFRCEDNAKPVKNHIMALDGSPQLTSQERNTIQWTSKQIAAPGATPPSDTFSEGVVTQLKNCADEDAAFEDAKEVMRVGFPASEADYWRKKYTEARDAYDLCRERLQRVEE